MPPPSVRVAITADNAGEFGRDLFLVSEHQLMLADIVSVTLQKLDGTSLDPAPTACVGGELTQSYDDADGNGKLSAGDALTTVYSECRQVAADGSLKGTARVEVTEVDDLRGADEVAFAAVFSTDGIVISRDDGSSVRLETAFDVLYHRTLYGEELVATAHSQIAGTRSDYELVKTQDYESATYTFAVRGTLYIVDTQETAIVETVEPFASAFNTFPQSGLLRISGDAGSQLQVKPDALSPGHYVIEVDPEGDGEFVPAAPSNAWNNIARGYFWWYAPGAPSAFVHKLYDPNDFEILNWRPFTVANGPSEQHGLKSPLRLQTSRVINPDSLAGIQLRLQKIDDAWPYQGYFVDLDAEVRGAVIFFYPASQLDPGGVYVIDPQFVWISDMLGNQDAIAWFDSYLRMAKSLAARVTPFEAWGYPGDSIALSATDSTFDDGSGLSFAWSQAEGPTATIQDGETDSATVILPAVNAPARVRVLARATNDFGEFDFAKSDITVFPNPAAIDLVVVRGWKPDGTMEEYLLTPANGSQEYTYNGSWGLSVRHDTYDQFIGEGTANVQFGHELMAGFSTDYQDVLVPGDYTGIVWGGGKPSMSLDRSFSCDYGTGEFHVLEFEADASDTVSRLAIDFAKECYPGGEYIRVSGHIRKASLIPIPPAN